MVDRAPIASLQSTALMALKLIPKVCGLASNVAVRAWVVGAALERGDLYETQASLEQLADVARMDIRVGALNQVGQEAVTKATDACIAWFRWVKSGQRGKPCAVCERPDFYGSLDNRGVCVGCRDAAEEAGVEIKLPVLPTPVQAYCDPAQDDWDDEEGRP